MIKENLKKKNQIFYNIIKKFKNHRKKIDIKFDLV